MGKQRDLFEEPQRIPENRAPALERFQGAMVCSAIGDALGWPTEFLREDNKKKPSFSLPIRDFVKWRKIVGGRWWGYRADIGPGEYSDDTQLALAVARSISSAGDFEPERFAYSEFPLWLNYERGGGRSVKTAARSLISRKTDWLHNFYKRGETDYPNAGANGAAMRNLPIALVSFNDEWRLIRDSFFNAIISHGHPRAILGTILISLGVRYALSDEKNDPQKMIEYLRYSIDHSWDKISDDNRIIDWVKTWENKTKGDRGAFKNLYDETVEEAHRFLAIIPEFLNRPIKDYYNFVGALDPSTKGSGLGTCCVAIFLYLYFRDDPFEAIFSAVNQLGSDTDTIASLVGALSGAQFGKEGIPNQLWERIQDRDYLIRTAERLYSIVFKQSREHIAADIGFTQEEAYLRILAWEIGLHEMFWDAIGPGGSVIHPSLGRGVISGKDVQNIAREGYVVKLIRIKFDCGQSCIFHSRVENNDIVSESLAKDLQNALSK